MSSAGGPWAPATLSVDLTDALGHAAAALHRNDPDAFTKAWRSIPVEIRATVAISLLTALDQPRSRANVARVGQFARAIFDKKDVTMTVLEQAVPVVTAHLVAAGRPIVTVDELTEELRRRDAVIADLRAQLTQRQRDLAQLLDYARDLHEQLRPEYEENLRTRSQRVVDARPRFSIISDSNDPDGPEEDR